MYFLCDNIVLFRQFQPFSSDRTDPTSNIHKFQNDYMKRRQKWAVNPTTYFVCHEIFLPMFLWWQPILAPDSVVCKKIIDFYIWSNSYKYVWFLSDLSEFFSLKLNGKIGWDPSTESRLPAARSWPCARCNAPQLYLKLRSVFGIPSVVVIAGGRGSPPYLSAPAHITHTGEGRHPPLPYNIIIWEFIINTLFLWLMTFLMILFWILWMLVEVSL